MYQYYDKTCRLSMSAASGHSSQTIDRRDMIPTVSLCDGAEIRKKKQTDMRT